MYHTPWNKLTGDVARMSSLVCFLSLEWVTQHCPRVVLDKLEKKGYRVVCMTGINQTCVWTLFKPDDSQQNDNNNKMTLRAPPTRADATEIMDTFPEKRWKASDSSLRDRWLFCSTGIFDVFSLWLLKSSSRGSEKPLTNTSELHFWVSVLLSRRFLYWLGLGTCSVWDLSSWFFVVCFNEPPAEIQDWQTVCPDVTTKAGPRTLSGN